MGIVPAWKEWAEKWNKVKGYDDNDFMKEYHSIGVYWLVSLTVIKQSRQ